MGFYLPVNGVTWMDSLLFLNFAYPVHFFKIEPAFCSVMQPVVRGPTLKSLPQQLSPLDDHDSSLPISLISFCAFRRLLATHSHSQPTSSSHVSQIGHPSALKPSRGRQIYTTMCKIEMVSGKPQCSPGSSARCSAMTWMWG